MAGISTIWDIFLSLQQHLVKADKRLLSSLSIRWRPRGGISKGKLGEGNCCKSPIPFYEKTVLNRRGAGTQLRYYRLLLQEGVAPRKEYLEKMEKLKRIPDVC